MISDQLVLPHEEVYITTFGDCHIGDESFTKESEKHLISKVEWVLETPNAYAVFNGDIGTFATRSSKTSPFAQVLSGTNQVKKIKQIFLPLANAEKIKGAVEGNHEKRLDEFAGLSPTEMICEILGIKYFKYTAIIDFKLGNRFREGKNKTHVNYVGVWQHTTGGGKKLGSKVERINEMRLSTIPNADFYVGGHNHALGFLPVSSREYDSRNRVIIQRRQVLVLSGGYLQWDDSYAEGKQLYPLLVNSPTIILDGKKKYIRPYDI